MGAGGWLWQGQGRWPCGCPTRLLGGWVEAPWPSLEPRLPQGHNRLPAPPPTAGPAGLTPALQGTGFPCPKADPPWGTRRPAAPLRAAPPRPAAASGSGRRCRGAP